MRTIVVDVRMLSFSGIGRYLSSVLPLLLSSSRFCFSLILYASDVDKFSFLRNVEFIPITAPIYSIAEQIQLVSHIKKCDVFWSPHFNVPFLPIRAKKRVVTIHDVYHLANANNFSFFKRFYAKTILSKAVEVSDRIITISNFSRSEILKYTSANEHDISVIHCGIDTCFFRKDDLSQTFFKIKQEAPYFLYVGNMKKYKNVQLLLHAYETWLSSEGDRIKLVLVGKEFGDFSPRIYIEKSPHLNKNVFMYSSTNDDDLKSLYKHALALVMPSLYEGFGLTPLEAMASGCPALVSHAASLPEVCGDAASYFDPTSSSDLLRAMKQVVYDPSFREQLIEKGYRKVQEYCWKKAAEEHIKVFDSLFIN